MNGVIEKDKNLYDVVIIGGGVVGCATARELSRYRLRVCLLEAAEDVCSGTSKANSGIVHAGFDAEPGSLKAQMNVRGNDMIRELAGTLNFAFRQNASVVLCFDEADMHKLNDLYERGVKNGVEGLKILSREEIMQREPNLSDSVVAALYAPTGGIVCPFDMTIAFAENAFENGVDFRFLHRVTDIAKTEEGFIITAKTVENNVASLRETGFAADGTRDTTLQRTPGSFPSGGTRDVSLQSSAEQPAKSAGLQTIHTRYIVNAAGVHSDEIHNLICPDKLRIIPRIGEYCLLDKSEGTYVNSTVFQLPGKMGKGILVTPTVHGNLLVGPTAEDIEDKDDTSTSAAGMQTALDKALLSVKAIARDKIITSFAGVRAHEEGGDFVLGENASVSGFFDAAGIESPGLTSAPAIGEYLAVQIAEKAGAALKDNFRAERKGILRPSELSFEERQELIRKNPAYGNIICRCEQISEGEILDAIRRPLGAVSLDGIKRRVRQGMGRCQAGFCSPKVIMLLAKELQIAPEQVCKNVPGSEQLSYAAGEGDGMENSHERI